VSLELVIVTPEGEAFSGPVESVVLPGAEGRFGVLERHERFLAPLQCGAAEIRSQEGTLWAAVSEGFADVSAEQVVVLVDECRRAEDIDAAAVARERDAHRAELEVLGESDEHQARRRELESALARAEAQLEVAGQS
jgi:F-type H+-transporting ATPase subunit epsilon